MKLWVKVLIACNLGLIICSSASATAISYDVVNLGGNQWEYTYSVTNDTLGVDIEEFAVYFDVGSYDNLVTTNTPIDWDPIAINPDPGIPDDGYYDVLALSTGILPSKTLSGFSVQFDYLGSGIPGSQRFEIIDPLSFSVLDSGQTIAASQPIPEPSTFFLFGFGLIGLAGLRERRSI